MRSPPFALRPADPDAAPLDALQQRLGYTFRDRALLERAMIHSSLLQDRPDLHESNQRLEFLGDAVLQLVLSESLFNRFPEEREGPLSRRRSGLANGAFLARLGRELGIEPCLQLAASEEATGGRSRDSAVEDAFEALVGAVFLDSDFPTVRRVVLALYGDLDERLSASGKVENPKGRLQELIQPEHGNNAVQYQVVRIEGEDHAREYEVAVFVKDRQLGTGRGSSKKLAEEAAALQALETLHAGRPEK
jgi:ribonuclease-3